MSNKIKKSSKEDSDLIAFLKDFNFFLRIKLHLDEFQSYSIIFSVIALPISYLFGFTGEKILFWKIIFCVTIILDVFIIYYSIKLKKKKTVDNGLDINDIHSFSQLNMIGWKDFERFSLVMLRDWGYQIDDHTQSTHDQGADLIVHKKSIDYVVEVKYRKKAYISSDILVNLVTRAMKYYNTKKAWLVTNSYLNPDARNYYNLNKDILKITEGNDIRKYIMRRNNED